MLRQSTPMSRGSGFKPESRTPLSRLPVRCGYCRLKLTEQEREKGKALHDACVDPWAKDFAAKLVVMRKRTAEKAARADRVATREKLNAFKTIPKLIAEAQTAFNAFIRERDREKGCFVCGRPFNGDVPGQALHAGHVRSRGAAGHLRFNEDNCHGECEGCNGPHGAKPHQIEAGAIRRIGQERFDALKNDNEPHKWERDELIAIKATYRAKLKALREAA